MDRGRRRMLWIPLAALPAACKSLGGGSAMAGASPDHATAVARPAALGQRWVYNVRNSFNGELVDEVTESVVSAGPVVRIARQSRARGRLADEVQSPWGMISVDSHWESAVEFDRPLPAWPESLPLPRTASFDRQYRAPGSDSARFEWDMTMRPAGWSTVTVPAGAFDALHYRNQIRFVSDDVVRLENERFESIWFAPEVGRWVLRRDWGRYFVSGRGGDRYEDFLVWELVAWA